MLLRDVEVGRERVDVRIDGGLVTALGALERQLGEEVVDGCGGALIPGLADHHLHLAAIAAARSSVDLGEGLEALRSAVPVDGWIRGTGVNPSDLPTPADLDALRSDVPVRVQDRGGAVWVLNQRAQDALGLDGVLWRQDDLLRQRLPSAPPDLGPVVAELLGWGVTHLTDATPDLAPDTVAWLRGAVPQHLLLLGDPAGTGPVKLVLGDHQLPGLDELGLRIATAHSSGRPVAVHSVTAASLALVIAVLQDVGSVPGDRIEHAAVVPRDAIATLSALGVAVVTQPTIWAAKGARFCAESEPADLPDLWRHRTLIEGEVLTVCSSDAPYGDPDPWVTLRAAREQGEEAVGPDVVLDGLLRDPRDLATRRTVAVGSAADLVLLHGPLAEAVRDPQAEHVRLTLLRGAVVSGE